MGIIWGTVTQQLIDFPIRSTGIFGTRSPQGEEKHVRTGRHSAMAQTWPCCRGSAVELSSGDELL
jgi:hypothetical protein